MARQIVDLEVNNPGPLERIAFEDLRALADDRIGTCVIAVPFNASVTSMVDQEVALGDDDWKEIAQYRPGPLQERARFRRLWRRLILAIVTGCAPEALRFESLPQGKPRCCGPAEACSVHFNATQTPGWFALALSVECEVGLDAEESKGEDWRPLARRLLAPGEGTQFESRPAKDAHRAVLRRWTRMESWAKLEGLGLAESAGERNQLSQAWRDPQWARDRLGIVLLDVDWDPELVATLAMRRVPAHLRMIVVQPPVG